MKTQMLQKTASSSPSNEKFQHFVPLNIIIISADSNTTIART